MRKAILSESQAMSESITAKEIKQAFPNLLEE